MGGAETALLFFLLVRGAGSIRLLHLGLFDALAFANASLPFRFAGGELVRFDAFAFTEGGAAMRAAGLSVCVAGRPDLQSGDPIDAESVVRNDPGISTSP